MQLREGEKLIKDGMVEYSWKPLLLRGMGNMSLTDKRLVLEYYRLAIPGISKVHGILRREIEILLTEVTEVKGLFPGSGTVAIQYVKEKKITKYLYFGAFKAFSLPLSELQMAADWIQKIKEAKNI